MSDAHDDRQTPATVEGGRQPDAERQLAERIKAERDYLGLSQEQVAAALGIPRAAVSAIETSRRKVSGLELARLAALFGTTPDRLLGAEAKPDPTDVQL